MLSSDHQKELIDAYLKGSLSPEEMPIFEEHLHNNVAFKNELDLQKSIVQTLKANRKAELKNRLNAIDVSTSHSNWWKYAAMVGLISSIGLWFYMNKAENSIFNSAIQQDIERTTPLIKSDEAVVIDSKTNEKPVLEQNSGQIASKLISEEAKSAKKVPKNKDKDALPNLPKLHSPDGAGVHEPISKELDAPDHRLTQTPHLSTSLAGVEVVKSKKHKFHYRYFDNKLFLYGNFDANTYDILELNTSKGQSLYLKYENNYYGLEADKTEISKLEQVKDRQIAKELEEIQNK